VLKGDDFSSGARDVAGASVVASVNDKAMGLLAILGFSDRLIGGGMDLKEASRRNSPDRRGGGGEGGCDGDNLGDLVDSSMGV
jgi:hypothetical protein